jgi:glutathione peroxidase
MRTILRTFGLLLVTLQATTTIMASSLYDIPLTDIDGKQTSLKQYHGKVVLVVNVASKCGYTRQYTPLQAIYEKNKAQGLVVVGFPCNDFGAQEPGTPEEIKGFCSSKFNVTFPLYGKVKVKAGPGQDPLFTALTGKDSAFPGEIKWNFAKFLIDRNGKLVQRFESGDEPDGEKLVKAVEAALASK